jgi:hypothetical protein
MFLLLGAVGVSHNVYVGLELKHIQLDSLGHVLTRHVPTCAHFTTQSTLFGNTLKFFTGNYKEVSIEQFFSEHTKCVTDLALRSTTTIFESILKRLCIAFLGR